MYDLILEIPLFLLLKLLLIAHPLEKALLVLLLLTHLTLLQVPLLAELSVQHLTQLLLLLLTHCGLFASIFFVLLFLIFYDLDPLILRHLTG